MNRPEPCEFCGRRPLSPGARKLRDYIKAIWDAPTPWEIERAKEAEAKAKAEVAAALASMPFDGPGLVKAAKGRARARGE